MNKLPALCAAALLAMLVSPLHAETVNCNSEGKDLQKAIDHAPVGATLFISGNCDTGPFLLSRDIELIGIGSPTLSAPGGGFATVNIQRTSVTLQNLTIDATGTEIGIYFEGGSRP